MIFQSWERGIFFIWLGENFEQLKQEEKKNPPGKLHQFNAKNNQTNKPIAYCEFFDLCDERTILRHWTWTDCSAWKPEIFEFQSKLRIFSGLKENIEEKKHLLFQSTEV